MIICVWSEETKERGARREKRKSERDLVLALHVSCMLATGVS